MSMRVEVLISQIFNGAIHRLTCMFTHIVITCGKVQIHECCFTACNSRVLVRGPGKEVIPVGQHFSNVKVHVA